MNTDQMQVLHLQYDMYVDDVLLRGGVGGCSAPHPL